MTPPRDSVTPETLLEDAARGDVTAFAELVALLEGRVAALLGRLLDDPRDVQEATQDTFVQAWRHLDTFRGEAAVFTWLYRIATNTARMRMRRHRLHTVPIDALRDVGDVHGPDFTADVDAGLDLGAFVRSALVLLPPDQRVVVVLRDVEGFSNDEVATLVGASVSTVKTRLHRGRNRLRAQLHPARRDVLAPSTCQLDQGVEP